MTTPKTFGLKKPTGTRSFGLKEPTGTRSFGLKEPKGTTKTDKSAGSQEPTGTRSFALEEPKDVSEFLVLTETKPPPQVAVKGQVAALKNPKDYTDEDLIFPERQLLKQTVDVKKRFEQRTSPWWVGAHTVGTETVGGGVEVPQYARDKDFVYYAGAPNRIDEVMGLTRRATYEEIDANIAKLVEKGFNPSIALEMAPVLAWKDELSREKAMKSRFSNKALKSDRDLSNEYVQSVGEFLKEETDLRLAVEELYRDTIAKFSVDQKYPETKEQQVAALRKLNAEGTEQDKEIAEHGFNYLQDTRYLLRAAGEEYNTGVKISEQLQKTAWIRQRNVLSDEIAKEIKDNAPENYAQASALAEEIVGLKGNDEQFEYYVDPSGYATTSGLKTLGKATLSDDYVQGSIKSGIYVDQEGADVLSVRPFGGGGTLRKKDSPLPEDFKALYENYDRYQAAVKKAAQDKNPQMLSQLIAYKKAYGALRAYEAGFQVGEKVELQGQRIVRRPDEKGAAAAEREAATKWAREIIFLNDVLAYRNNLVAQQVDTAAEFAGVDPRAMAEIVFSRKLQASGAKANEQAFDYEATFNAIKEHQMTVIAQSLGYEDYEDMAYSADTVESLSSPDARKGEYTYINSLGDEITIRVTNSPSDRLSHYAEKIAHQKAKKIINQELMRGKGVVFVRQATTEQRAAAARNSGIPFLYNTFVPSAPSDTLYVNEDGYVVATENTFKEGSFAIDYTAQVFNSTIAYTGAVGHELWDSGVISDMSSFATTEDGSFNWQGLGGQQTLKHRVAEGETLEDIAFKYYGSRENMHGQLWVERQRVALGLGPGEQPPVGTRVSVHRDVFDVLNKAAAVALGTAKDVNVWEEMVEREQLLATEQLLDLAEWSAHNLDLSGSVTLPFGGGPTMTSEIELLSWGDFDLDTKSAALGALFATSGIYADVRAIDAFTGTMVIAGKGIQAGKAYRQARQVERTANEMVKVVDEAYDYDSLVQKIREINPGADYVYEAKVAAAMGIDENVSAQLRALDRAREQEQILLRRAELDEESLVSQVERAEATAAKDRATENILEIQLKSEILKKEAYESVVSALDKQGAVAAAKKYKQELEAAGVLQKQTDAAVASRDSFIAKETTKSHVRTLENNQKQIKDAVEQESAASKSFSVEAENVKTVVTDLRLQKRSLNARMDELRAAQRQELDDIALQAQPVRAPTAELVVRAKNAGVPIDINRPPTNLSSFRKKVSRAESKAGKKDVNPDDVEAVQKELDKVAAANKKKSISKRRAGQEAAKKRHKAEKQEILDQIKDVNKDIKYLTAKRKPGAEKLEGSPDAERFYNKKKTAKERLDKARKARESQVKQAREYRASKEAKKIREELKKLDAEVFRSNAALARVEGSAYSRLAAYAPGINMGVLKKSDAVDALEEAVQRNKQAALDADEAVAAAKKKYLEFQTSRKTAQLSAREAERALDKLIEVRDRKARLEQSIRGQTEQQDVWRKIALNMARELREGNGLLKAFPDQSVKFVDPLGPSTMSVNARTGERVIDTKLLRKSYDEMYGEDAVNHFLKTEPEMAKPLNNLLSKTGEVTLSGSEVFGIQQLQAGLLRAREAVHPKAQSIATVRAIAQAKGDVDMMRVSLRASKNYFKRAGQTFLHTMSLNPDWLAYTAARIENQFNSINNRVGPIAGEYAALLKSADYSASMINDDLRLIQREAHGGTLLGGAPGVVLETFNANKKSLNSQKATNLYFDLVDGDVQRLSTTVFGEVEAVDVIRGLQQEVKSLDEKLKDIDRKLKIESEVPGETLLDDALREASENLTIKQKELEEAVAAQRVLEERFYKMKRDVVTQSNRLSEEADLLEKTTKVSDNEYSVFNNYTAAMQAREAGDTVAFQSRITDAAQASGVFSPAKIRDMRTGFLNVFGDAEETVLRNLAAAVETKLTRPQALRQEADDLLVGFERGNHPQQNNYDRLVAQIRESQVEVAAAEKAGKLAEARIKNLERGQLPEDLMAALTSRQQVVRKQHEYKRLEQKVAVRQKDVDKLDAEIEDLQNQIDTKPAQIQEEIAKLEQKAAPLYTRLQAAQYVGNVDESSDLAASIASINKEIDEAQLRFNAYAETRTNTVDGSTIVEPRFDNTNPLYNRIEKARAQRDDVFAKLSSDQDLLADINTELRQLIDEVGFTSINSETKLALVQERKYVERLIAETNQKIKDQTKKPSYKEASDFLEFSDEGNALRAATVRKLKAENRLEQLQQNSSFVAGESEFHAQLLKVAIEQEKNELARVLQATKPEEGTISSVQKRISNARQIANALKKEPLIDSYEETLRLLTNQKAFTYGMHIEKLASAEQELLLATRAFDEAKPAYSQRLKALMDGDEVMPVGNRQHGELIVKKNIPIKVGARTTASNTGMTVPWDDAVHQFRYTDLLHFNKKVEAAAKQPGNFSTNLRNHGVSEAFMGLSRMWLPRGHKLSDYNSTELLSSAADILASGKGTTFREFSDAMRLKTYQIIKETSGIPEQALLDLNSTTKAAEAEHSIAMGAYNVLRASLLKKTLDRMVTTHGAMFTTKQADAINAFLGAEAGIKSIDPADWPDVVEGLNRLGTPITQTHVGARHGLAEKTTRLIASGATAEGSTIYAREDLIGAINDVFNDAAKRSDRFYRASSDSQMGLGSKVANNKLYSMWKQSVTTGLILPNPHYWANTAVGDFSQMAFTVGYGTATKQSLMNLPHFVPVLGKYWQPWVSTMTHWSSNKPVLGTLTNAWFNPHLNSIWNRKPGYIVFKGGQTASYDDVYRFAVEDGIIDSVIQQEFLAALDRGKTAAMKNKFESMATIGKNWNEDILLFADFAQKRQRMALYVDLLQKGYTRKEAARLTLEALYDWKHGVSQWEVAKILWMSPFWRFWKNALKQTARVYTDPLTKPDKVIQELMASGLGEVPAGSAAAQRMRQTLIAADRGGEMLYEQFAQDTEPAQARFYTDVLEDGRAQLKEVYMDASVFMQDYMLDNLYYGTTTLSDQKRKFFDTELVPLGGLLDPLGNAMGIAPGRSPFPDSTSVDAHRSYTHAHYIGPKFSTIESFVLFSTLSAWAVSGGYAAKEAIENGEDTVITPDFIEDFVLKPSTKVIGGPVAFPMLEAAAKMGGYEIPFGTLDRYAYRGGYSSTLSEGEAYLMSAMNLNVTPAEAREQLKEDPKPFTPGTAGKYVTDNAFGLFLLRNLPFVMQLPTKVDQAYFRNPDVQRGLFPAAYGAFQQMGGLPYKPVYFDPKQIFTGKQYEVDSQFKAMKEKYGKLEADRKAAKSRAAAERDLEQNIEFLRGEGEIAPLPEGMSTDELLEGFGETADE